MRHRRRFARAAADDDPLALVPNLFDVSIVLAVAFLVAAISVAARNEAAGPMESGLRKAAATVDRTAAGKALERPAGRKAEGRGTRLGVAYQLDNGEVIYVPD
jgi:hypothetical protein